MHGGHKGFIQAGNEDFVHDIVDLLVYDQLLLNKFKTHEEVIEKTEKHYSALKGINDCVLERWARGAMRLMI